MVGLLPAPTAIKCYSEFESHRIAKSLSLERTSGDHIASSPGSKQVGLATAGWSGPTSVRFLVSPETETPQPQWAACNSV